MEFKPELIDSRLEDLIPGYLKNILDNFEKLKELYLEKNYSEMKKNCHKVLGTAVSYGFFQLDTLISQLQGNLHSLDLSEIEMDMKNLNDYFIFIRSEYKNLIGPD